MEMSTTGDSVLGKRTLFDAVMSGSSDILSRHTGVPSPIIEGVIRSGIDTLSASSQQSVLNAAQQRAEALSGGSARDTERSNVSIPGAALIPGRGAELGLANINFQRPSKLKMKPSGAKMHNAFAEQVKAYGPVDCKMAFAYKALLPVVLTANASPPTRFVNHSFFRHTNTSINSVNYADTTTAWNNTLGPDDSYIRQMNPTGSAYSVPIGYNQDLKSPYRYPQNNAVSEVRMNRAILENIGWNANPFKPLTVALGSGNDLTTTSPVVYSNAPIKFVDSDAGFWSHPSQQPRAPANPGNIYTATSCYYRSQMAEGSVNYQFSNDGTSAVVVDVVITKLKKGEKLADAGQYKDALLQAFGEGYMNMTLANRGVIDLAGGAPTSTDVIYNSKVEFLPKKALDYYRRYSAYNTPAPRAISFVARDQFMIGAGSVKPWSFNLPAVNYDARTYLEETSGGDGGWNIDDLTYCVSMSFSTVSTPVVEAGAVGTSVIDRRGNALNVAVTGTYKETPHPAYLAEYVNNFYVNGVLNAPYYTSAVPHLSRVNILPPETASRDSTQASAFAVVGPTNTQSGA